MAAERLDVVEALLSNEDGPSLEAYFAEGLLMIGLEMPLKRGNIRELLVRPAIVNHALQSAQIETCLLASLV